MKPNSTTNLQFNAKCVLIFSSYHNTVSDISCLFVNTEIIRRRLIRFLFFFFPPFFSSLQKIPIYRFRYTFQGLFANSTYVGTALHNPRLLAFQSSIIMCFNAIQLNIHTKSSIISLKFIQNISKPISGCHMYSIQSS